MKGQYEQECNAEALKRLGIMVLDSIEKDFDKHLERWVDSSFVYNTNYINNVPYIVEFILESHQFSDTDDQDLFLPSKDNGVLALER